MITLDSIKNRNNRKVFKHDYLEEHNCYNRDLPTGRVYVIPDGREYPSVTTFLGKVSDKKDSDWFQRWVEKLGSVEAADAESKRCADRGSGVHLALEYLLRNQPDVSHAGEYVKMYNQIETILNINVDNVRGNEIPLYSHKLQLAGRCDLIADYKGVLSIIDFKTSNNFKDPSWINDYFLQCTCYQLMLQEMYGLKAEQIVILIAVEKQERPQVYIRQPREFYPLLAEKIKLFRFLMEEEKKKLQESTSLFDMF